MRQKGADADADTDTTNAQPIDPRKPTSLPARAAMGKTMPPPIAKDTYTNQPLSRWLALSLRYTITHPTGSSSARPCATALPSPSIGTITWSETGSVGGPRRDGSHQKEESAISAPSQLYTWIVVISRVRGSGTFKRSSRTSLVAEILWGGP